MTTRATHGEARTRDGVTPSFTKYSGGMSA
ncbi:hypothetical protein SAMN05216276_1018115 [Streptosporangium subroseum]|uniref:Uncharacterized protein n=1 Tax=Streptosporangium subroseum TaxID=106412 RepID=A0A239I499_9ACTN|nr:hypothetical protein SAMN05216276_1018115 [Streptosporangium subroseum]